VVSDPMPPHTVVEHAAAIGADLWLAGRDFNVSGDKQQWGWAGRGKRFNALGYPALRGANQLVNAAGVLAVVQAMNQKLPISAQAVRSGFAFVTLPGRFQTLAGQPTVVLDVAHNPHSVAALAENLDAMGFHPHTHAVFGAMADKDLATMLQRISPLIDSWHLCTLPTPRAATPQALAEVLSRVNPQLKLAPADSQADSQVKPIPATVSVAKNPAFPADFAEKPPKKASTAGQMHLHATPAAGFAAARAAADPTDRIVVFGSFHTVGGVLAQGLPQLQAPHLG
jgi:dihydrofolate synthase / folylpolyglutamate synthase